MICHFLMKMFLWKISVCQWVYIVGHQQLCDQRFSIDLSDMCHQLRVTGCGLCVFQFFITAERV